jgi:hypothetical protein
MHVHAGLGSMSVSDWGPWQGGISYGQLATAEAAHEHLHGFGVTHVLWQTGKSVVSDSLAGDLVFYDLVHNHALAQQAFGNLTLARLPAPRPRREVSLAHVVIFACDLGYASGSYRLRDLTVPTAGPLKDAYPKPFAPASPAAALSRARFVVIERACAPAELVLSPDFVLGAQRGAAELWLRKDAPSAAR